LSLIEEEVPFTDARAGLSNLLDRAKTHRPQVITRHGKKEGVLLSWEDYERLSRRPNFGRLLMSAPIEEGDLPERPRAPHRRRVEF
jgi:prevent-host-death family protein